MNLYLKIATLLLLFVNSNLLAQCPYDNTFWLDLTPPCPGSNTTTCIFGGEYCTVNVVAGNTYTFSTCGTAAFDTEITLFTAGGGAVIASNDDFCGFQSEITWVATFTGVVEILVDQWLCVHNSTCAELVVSCTPAIPPPSGDCIYSLNLFDSFGDGWGASEVCVTVNPPGTTNCYTIPTGTTNTILIGVNIGDIISITYNANGAPWQGEISYSLTLNGGLMFTDGPNPTTGLVYTDVVDCIPPPASAQDCVGGITICSNQTLNGNSGGTGSVIDLDASNEGCLASAEQQGTWYYFSPSTGGTIGMTISPQNAADDYDFAIWGPYATASCPPPGPPLRCSYAAPSGDTGMNGVAVDNSEGAFGDKWVSDMNVLAGEVYIMYIDNWTTSGQPFDLSWQLSGGASLDCTVLPVELLSFTVDNLEVANRLEWATATELNTDHFVLQRSANGHEFLNIGSTDAAGQSNNTLHYTHFDESPLPGLNYYRLKQVDLNGEYSYSSVITTSNTFDQIHIEGPLIDPGNGSIDLVVFSSSSGSLIFDLFDLTGRQVMHFEADHGAGADSIQIPTQNPSQGTYIYSISAPDGSILKSGRINLGIRDH